MLRTRPLRMALTSEQQWKIAAVYEKAAADNMTVPSQQRAAFARKANWFRMLARIRARKEAAAALKERRPSESSREFASAAHALHPKAAVQEVAYQTLAERLKKARAVAGT
jgi:hypothetical protein